MNASNLVVLLGLVGVTGAASWATATRLGLRSFSERLLAAFVLGNLLVLAPVYALAALSVLTPVNTVLATLVVGGLALATALSCGPAGQRSVGVVHTASRVSGARARLARVGADCTLLSVVPLIGMLGLFGWLVATSYFAPSFRGYDAPWYHEPITSFAIQERGLHVPELAPRLFYVSSLARGSELFSAWLVLVTGTRALIELPSVLGFAGLWLATYRLARGLAASRERALGWATVVVLTPGLLVYAQSTYVDLHVCALLTASLYFACARPAAAGALLAVVAAGLAMSMKLFALGPSLVVMGVVLVRARAVRLAWSWRSAGAAALVFASAGVALATPLRNLIVFGNPLYPVSITIPFLGHVLPGPIATTSRDFEMTPRWDELLRLVFQPLAAYTSEFTHYVEVHAPMESAPAFNYGYAMPTIGLALAVLALGRIASTALAAKSRGSAKPLTRSLWRVGIRRNGAILMLLVVAAFFLVFPITRLARYLGLVLACTGALAATALESRAAHRIGNALLVVALIAQFCLIVAQSPRILYAPAELWQLARMPPADRELARDYGAFASRDAARFRDRALTAGTTVLFGDDVLEPGPLWNSAMSNRVVYLPGDGDPTEAADARGAAFVACTNGSPRCTVLAQRGDAWTLVGELYPGIIWRECVLYRRIGAAPR